MRQLSLSKLQVGGIILDNDDYFFKVALADSFQESSMPELVPSSPGKVSLLTTPEPSMSVEEFSKVCRTFQASTVENIIPVIPR